MMTNSGMAEAMLDALAAAGVEIWDDPAITALAKAIVTYVTANAEVQMVVVDPNTGVQVSPGVVK